VLVVGEFRPLITKAEAPRQDILRIRTRLVEEMNHYGWILLRAVFERGWKAGKGRDQVEAFRAIPRPFTGRIMTRNNAETVMEKAKTIVFKMTNEQTPDGQQGI
jgi:hypothetical protein